MIRDENGNIICTLIFDAEGRLRTIAFGAPSRNGGHQTAQQNGFYFTVTGLSSGTTYSYTMTAKDSNDNILDTRSGSFTTQTHGLQPTRLLHPWDFPGQSTGVGCHCYAGINIIYFL